MEQNQRMDWGNCGCIYLVKIKLIHDDSEKLKLTLHHVRKIQFAEKYSC